MLKNKTALITGASRGIGRAIATMYAEHGSNIAFTYINEDDEAHELTKLLQTKGVQVLCIKSDAANFDAAHEVVKQVIDTFGSLDILVCNAGITRDTLLMRMSEQQWDDVLDVNLKSVFNYCHAVSMQMMRQRSGSIIAMSSIVGMAGNPGQVNYAASKAAQTNMMQSLSLQLASSGITVNNVAPGVIYTDRNIESLSDPEYAKKVTDSIPVGFYGEPKDCAGIVSLLCSDDGRYITGQSIYVDGGKSVQ